MIPGVPLDHGTFPDWAYTSHCSLKALSDNSCVIFGPHCPLPDASDEKPHRRNNMSTDSYLRGFRFSHFFK